MSVSDMQSDMPQSLSSSRKETRPFAAVDNPTMLPCYGNNPSLAPSPVPDWTLQDVSEAPTDEPQYTPRHGGRRAFARSPYTSVASASARAAQIRAKTGSSSGEHSVSHAQANMSHFDSSLMEGGHDWFPDEFQGDHAAMEVSPKKRRVERVMHDDGVADMAMPMPMNMNMNMNMHPTDFHADHAPLDFEVHDSFDQEYDYHVYEDEMLYGYYEEDLHMHMHMRMPPPHHPRAFPRVLPHSPGFSVVTHPTGMPQRSPYAPPRRHIIMRPPHPHPHPHEYLDGAEVSQSAMDHQEAVPSAAPSSTRTPSASPNSSPAQMQGRRVVAAPAMVRHPVRQVAAYRPRYMNDYVPGVPYVPVMGPPIRMVGAARAFYRCAYPRVRQPYGVRYMNPANLPSPRFREAYRHLAPRPLPVERRGSAPPVFFSGHEDDAFWTQQGFFPPDGADDNDVPAEEVSPKSVSAIDQTFEESASDARTSPLKRKSLPSKLNFSSFPDASIQTASQIAPALPHREEERGEEDVTNATMEVAVENGQEDESLEVVHFRTKEQLSLAIEEDANWLSEFQSYVRLEFLEIFRAGHEDVQYRNTSRKVAFKQLGIRCKFCSHVHPGERARRSSAYPSSTAQIYQSFNMMIRDHFPQCTFIPKENMDMFQNLKAKNNQGAADSKHFWIYAAEKLGMVDSEEGIYMNDSTQLAAETVLPFSTTTAIWSSMRCPPVFLAFPEDKPLISEFLFELLSRVQKVNLLEVECRSTRKNLNVGLPGFGCRFCCQAGRLGFCRVFPTKRKGLPDKSKDMYEHFRRCSLCPPEVKERLETLRSQAGDTLGSTEKVFFDRLWSRLNGGTEHLLSEALN